MVNKTIADPDLPGWLPDAVRLYIDHTEEGLSLRALARREGRHPSTILRQVRRFENRREDPLVDEALERIGRVQTARSRPRTEKDDPSMTAHPRPGQTGTQFPAAAGLIADEETIQREARRILRRLAEPGAVLAIAPDMEKAAVLREFPDGRSARTGVLDRAVAQAFALKDWIVCRRPGRVAAYEITAAGRAALKRMLEADHRAEAGFAEAQGVFAGQHRVWAERDLPGGDGGEARRIRYNLAESPVALLARRRDKDGEAFLSPELVAAAERLREDFELAQMGPRVAEELRDLGPGLGDMVLRCCCFLEGLEVAEKRMGWSARSGKIVLRIALQRLRRHYEETGGGARPLIG